jgi:hypothetical protein
MSTTVGKPHATTWDGYTQTERRWTGNRDTGALRTKKMGKNVGIQVDELPVTAEAFTEMEHLTSPREVGTLKHWLRTVRDHMTRTNAEDEPEEDAVVTEVQETASTFSFPSTLPSGPSDESAALKPRKPPITA